jgi:hypothetical protein
MANDRNAGAKKKFPNNETEILHVRKIVPKGKATPLKKELIDKINQLQADALTKCANEALKSKQDV